MLRDSQRNGEDVDSTGRNVERSPIDFKTTRTRARTRKSLKVADWLVDRLLGEEIVQKKVGGVD